MLTLFYLWNSKSATDKDTGIVIFFLDIILLTALSFSVGYFCSNTACAVFAALLLAACLPAPFYFKYREKLRLSMLPPKGSPNKAYLEFQIAFDRAAPWRMYGDMFFDLFSPKSFVFFAILIAAGKLVAHFVG